MALCPAFKGDPERFEWGIYPCLEAMEHWFHAEMPLGGLYRHFYSLIFSCGNIIGVFLRRSVFPTTHMDHHVTFLAKQRSFSELSGNWSFDAAMEHHGHIQPRMLQPESVNEDEPGERTLTFHQKLPETVTIPSFSPISEPAQHL